MYNWRCHNDSSASAFVDHFAALCVPVTPLGNASAAQCGGTQQDASMSCKAPSAAVSGPSFDNTYWAFLAVAQVVTGDQWTSLVDTAVSANGEWSLLFFVLLVGSFAAVFVNAAIAIIGNNFRAAMKLFKQKKSLRGLRDGSRAADSGAPSARSDCSSWAGCGTRDGLWWDRCGRSALCCDCCCCCLLAASPASSEVPLVRCVNALRRHAQATRACLAPYFRLTRMAIATSVESPVFSAVVMGMTLANAVALALQSPGLSPDTLSTLADFNVVCVAVFWVELVFRFYAGPRKFFGDAFSLFDLLVCVVSAVELLMVSSGTAAASSLRVLRVVRLFKAARCVHRCCNAT